MTEAAFLGLSSLFLSSMHRMRVPLPLALGALMHISSGRWVLRLIPDPADRAALGPFAGQAQTGTAGDGPDHRDLVSPDGVRQLPVRLPGRGQAPAQPESPGQARWLAGGDGGVRPAGQLRALPGRAEDVEPRHGLLVVQMGPIFLMIASVFLFKGRFSLGAGRWLAGIDHRLWAVLQPAPGGAVDVPLGTYTAGVLTILLAGYHLGVLRPGPEAVADGVEFVAGDDGDLPVLRVSPVAVGASHGGATTEPLARLAVAGDAASIR